MIEVIPYIEINGTRSFPDTFMVSLFNRMKEDGNLEKTFIHGFPNTQYEFLLWAKNPLNKLFVALENKDPIILAWITDTIGKRGTVHFSSFNGIFARKKIRAAQKILQLLFKHYLVLIGLIPAAYEDTKHFSKMLGFKEVGEIPNFVYFFRREAHEPVSVQYITKELVEV